MRQPIHQALRVFASVTLFVALLLPLRAPALEAQDDDHLTEALVVAAAGLAAGLVLFPVPEFDVVIEGQSVEDGTALPAVRGLGDGLTVMKSGFFGGQESGVLTSLDDERLVLDGAGGTKTIELHRVKQVVDVESAAARFAQMRKRAAVWSVGGALAMHFLALDEPTGTQRTLRRAQAVLFGATAAYLVLRPTSAERELASRNTTVRAGPSLDRTADGNWQLGVNVRLELPR